MPSYNCTLYFSCCSFSLTLLKLLVLCLLFVRAHVCHLVFLQVQHKARHTNEQMLQKSYWCQWIRCLFISQQAQNSKFIQTHSLELVSSFIHLRIFLASVPDSELSLMRKVNTAYRWWMPIAMLKLIIMKERFLSVGNHEGSTLVGVNFFLLTGDNEITEDGIL